jgi:hypothetical protein
MPENAYPMNAANLLVHGTFALRRELDCLAHPIRRPGPPGRSRRTSGALTLPAARGRDERSPGPASPRPTYEVELSPDRLGCGSHAPDPYAGLVEHHSPVVRSSKTNAGVVEDLASCCRGPDPDPSVVVHVASDSHVHSSKSCPKFPI